MWNLCVPHADVFFLWPPGPTSVSKPCIQESEKYNVPEMQLAETCKEALAKVGHLLL